MADLYSAMPSLILVQINDLDSIFDSLPIEIQSCDVFEFFILFCILRLSPIAYRNLGDLPSH